MSLVEALPRPSRAMKALLGVLGALALFGAIVVHWAPGGEQGLRMFLWLAFEPTHPQTKPWTWLTSGLVTSPDGITHALWSMLGLYFLTPDLESRWGTGRLFRFLAASIVIGNLAVLGAALLPIDKAVFHPRFVFGPMAAITAIAIAWAKENASRQIRFMFFLPMSGRGLLRLTMALALLSLVFLQDTTEGAVAPLGGVVAGLLFGGTPSPVRLAWLRLKLFFLKRQTGGLTVTDILEGRTRPRPGKPSLRVLSGGRDDSDPERRKPPTDKRYLN
jgi:membrane associated rhomboid family serine protease